MLTRGAAAAASRAAIGSAYSRSLVRGTPNRDVIAEMRAVIDENHVPNIMLPSKVIAVFDLSGQATSLFKSAPYCLVQFGMFSCNSLLDQHINFDSGVPFLFIRPFNEFYHAVTYLKSRGSVRGVEFVQDTHPCLRNGVLFRQRYLSVPILTCPLPFICSRKIGWGNWFVTPLKLKPGKEACYDEAKAAKNTANIRRSGK